jgi:hypothetical protein
MKSATALALAAFFAGLVVSTPLDKRAYTTEIEVFTVTVTVTGFPPEETPTSTVAAAETTATEAADNNAWTSWNGEHSGNWGGGWGGSSGWNSGPPAAANTPPSSSSPDADTPSSTSTPDTAPSSSWPSTPESSPASSPASTAPAPISTTVSSDYKQGILDSHNMHRANASVPGLVWDDNMASIAAEIAASCVYAHNTQAGGGGYGQNIGAGAPDSEVAAMITNNMYNDEIGFYPGYGSEPDMTNFEKWGHYSQIVWKSTVGVGCFTQHCPNGLANVGSNVGLFFTVCNYSPPGKWLSHPSIA